jgi:hypothetical protein
LSEEPSIPDGTTQEELEELGYFAEEYQVFALEHQVADKFNDKFNDNSTTKPSSDFRSDKWNLQPNMVSRVYQKCGLASCRQQMFQEALKAVRPEQVLNEWEKWSKVARAGGELGIDLLKVVAETRNVQRLN